MWRCERPSALFNDGTSISASDVTKMARAVRTEVNVARALSTKQQARRLVRSLSLARLLVARGCSHWPLALHNREVMAHRHALGSHEASELFKVVRASTPVIERGLTFAQRSMRQQVNTHVLASDSRYVQVPVVQRARGSCRCVHSKLKTHARTLEALHEHHQHARCEEVKIVLALCSQDAAKHCKSHARE